MKPKAYKHQAEALSISKDKISFAYLMEMGSGKTRVVIENVDYLYENKKIEAVVIFCPNGLQFNWMLNEFPKWTESTYLCSVWTSTPNIKQKISLANLTSDRPGYEGLKILIANYESVRSTSFQTYIKDFLKKFKTIMVLDESTRIKNKSAKQTKFILSLTKLTKYRRIMSGLVSPNSPLDVYSQFEFLNPNILGFGSYFTFKNHFAIIEDNARLLNAIKQRSGSNRVPQLIKKDSLGNAMYKNLDQLSELIEPHSFRCLKSECLDLPEKVYKKIIIELSKKHRKIYDLVNDEILAEFETGTITVQLAIVRMLRLQQITGGFWKKDDDELMPIDDDFPKLDAIMDSIESTTGKVAIWTHYQIENNLIAAKLKKEYGNNSVVQYFGGVSKKEKELAVDRFSNIVRDETGIPHDEDTGCRFFVGEPHSGGIGLNLVLAENVYYYSNSFNLEDRLQSEDRHHRSGTKHTVTYYDIEALNTIDSKIISSLREKKNIAATITRDTFKEWI